VRRSAEDINGSYAGKAYISISHLTSWGGFFN